MVLPKKEGGKFASHKPNLHLQTMGFFLGIFKNSYEEEALQMAQNDQKKRQHRKRFRGDKHIMTTKPKKRLNIHREIKPGKLLWKWDIVQK